MADEKVTLPVEGEATAEVTAAPATKKEKKADAKKPNVFVRFGKWVKKLCKDTFNEMKKVRWTSKNELIKNSILVIVAVCATALALGIVDIVFSTLIDLIGRLFG